MQTEEALTIVESLRDLFAEFEFKVPAHALGRDSEGVALLAEKPIQDVVEALWLPMVYNANRRSLNAEYREVEERGTLFSCIYLRIPHPILDGLSIFGDSLDLWHKACENMLWTRTPHFGGAAGISDHSGISLRKPKR